MNYLFPGFLLIILLQELPPAPVVHTPGEKTALYTIVAGIFTLIIQQIFKDRSDKRQKEADKEEREANARIAKAEAENQTMILMARTEELIAEKALAEAKGREFLNRKIEETKQKIQENTDITVAAFKEANNVNQKIATIGLEKVETDRKIVEAVQGSQEAIKELQRKVEEKVK